MGKIIIIFLAILGFFLAFAFLMPENFVEIGDKKIKVEIADTVEKRNKGLMFRQGLCKDCGMLFIFEEEKRHGFWMKNTHIPLDIVFINSSFKIVDVVRADPCIEICETYIPKEKALYVLETMQGTFTKDYIGKTAKISF